MTRFHVSRFLTAVCFSLIIILSVTNAFAVKKEVSSSACDFGNTLFDQTSKSGAGLTSSIGCTLFTNTNDNAKNDIPGLDLFGIEDWVLADKSDGGGNGVIDLVVSFADKSDYLGKWSVDSFAGYKDVFITVKSGNGFAAYLLDTAQISGDWTTAALFPTKKGGKGLSHMSLFYSPDSLTVVPLPAAFPLYAAGMALLGFIGLRKRKS